MAPRFRYKVFVVVTSGVPALRSIKFWTVLKTKQASSSDAVANVREQAFEYLHLQLRERAVRGVRKIVPMFPHYLLVRVDERRQDWRVLCSTKGVTRVLMDGERPGKIHDEVIDGLRSMVDTDDGYFHDPMHESPRFNPGAVVEGMRGLFEGKYGLYKGLAGNRGDRVRVLFSFLGREAEFEVRADDLVVAAA